MHLCVHAHVYVLYYEKCVCVGGEYIVRIHILFLKGADVTDLQFTDFSPYHHEKYDFTEMFLDD